MPSTSKATYVTGLWDIGRGSLNGWASRDFSSYKTNFFKLLDASPDIHFVVYLPKQLETEVWKLKSRTKENTSIYFKEIQDFQHWFPFYQLVQQIRESPAWRNRPDAQWLASSPQAQLNYYNPIVMSKMFMLNDATLNNPFKSEYFYWLDGGITNTVNSGYFTHDHVLQKQAMLSPSFLFLSYPYEGNTEIHGFERKAMARYCQTDMVRYVCRGGYFGGDKLSINRVNDLYYSILQDTLSNGHLGTEECIFTIIAHIYTGNPVDVFALENEHSGLIYPYFEMLKSVELIKEASFTEPLPPTPTPTPVLTRSSGNVNLFVKPKRTHLYLVTFNSPPQLQLMMDSITNANPELFAATEKFLINNSVDVTTDQAYTEMAKRYDFSEIKMGNLGICGARQWAAQHFHDSGADYLVWFEDDMLLVSENRYCEKNGLAMSCPNWLKKCQKILEKEKLDFVKLAFSEFYGDHHKQWAWHNVPADYRAEHFPKEDDKRMKYSHSGSFDNLAYLVGEIYYSNWPSVMTREGNYKIFLETVYAYPYEQTIMSHAYQLTKSERLRSAVLMATLVDHNRVFHYSKDIRKEC